MNVRVHAATTPIRTLVPARLDRLPWTRFHWLIITGLGVSWLLDGLEIQIASTVGTVLQSTKTLHLSTSDVGTMGSVYLFGEVVGALVFGRITDIVGRKKMFFVTKAMEVKGRGSISYTEIARTMITKYPSRSFLGFSMMVTQAFLYNAIFFTYALVLQHFYNIPSDQIGYYFFPFALGNLIGPLVLGPLFDTVGRRMMIMLTYCGSAILLAVSAVLLNAGMLNAVTQTAFWCVIFFFASAGASSAYLTVSEIFPLELRGQAISFFFAISQAAGGVAAPRIFAALIGDGTHTGPLTIGYFIGAGVMFAGGLIGWFFGVNAERRALEDVATPLSAVSSVPGPSSTAAAS